MASGWWLVVSGWLSVPVILFSAPVIPAKAGIHSVDDNVIAAPPVAFDNRERAMSARPSISATGWRKFADRRIARAQARLRRMRKSGANMREGRKMAIF